MPTHLAFAVARVRDGNALSNPLTEDIRALFPQEFEVAKCGVDDLGERLGIGLGDDEVGLIALHVHSSLDAVHVSQAMQVAQLTRACIDAVERITGRGDRRVVIRLQPAHDAREVHGDAPSFAESAWAST